VDAVVVQGQRSTDADTRRESTVGMTVVGRDELDAHGDLSVLDVLQRLPGITLDGETPRMRGLGGGYTLILLNGEPAPPGFSLDSLAPADIERIEVIKGPTAEFSGAAGTINVILRQAPRLRQREVRAAIGYRAVAPQGSLSLSWGDRVGALGFNLPLTVSTWASAASADTQRSTRSTVGVPTQQQHLAFDQWQGVGLNFGPRLDYKINDEDSLQWQAMLQGNRTRNASQRHTQVLAGPPPTSVHDDASSRGHWHMARSQWQWARRASGGSKLELKAAVQESGSLSVGDSVLRNAQGDVTALRASEGRSRQHLVSQGGRWRWPWADGHTLAAGWDVDRRRRHDLQRWFENGVEQVTTSVGVTFMAQITRAVFFAQHEWVPAPRWSVMLGLRAEQLHTRSENPASTTQQRQHTTMPLLHLRHAFDDKSRDVLRASVSRSQRVPDIGLLQSRYSLNGTYPRDQTNTPLAPDSAGNPQLAPERLLGFELAYEHSMPEGGVFSAGLFHREVGRLIRRRIALETVAESPVPRWVSRPGNVGRANSSGLELEFKGRLDAWLPALGAAQWRAAVSAYRSAVEHIDDPDARLDGQPPWSATLGVNHALEGGAWRGGLSLVLTPSFSTQQTDLQRVWRGPQRRLDAFVLWRIERQLHLRLAVNNALAPASLSRSRVEDLDGFAAQSASQRQTVAQWTASIVSRF
jgi:iron complex outermembrane receptor protein